MPFHQVIGFDVMHLNRARGAVGPTETLQLDSSRYVLYILDKFAAYHRFLSAIKGTVRDLNLILLDFLYTFLTIRHQSLVIFLIDNLTAFSSLEY